MIFYRKPLSAEKFISEDKNFGINFSIKGKKKVARGEMHFSEIGGVAEVLDISTYDSSYVSLFITHFFNTPEKKL